MKYRISEIKFSLVKNIGTSFTFVVILIGCCFKIHKELGPGFNEKIYQNSLKILFENENIQFKMEKEFEVLYLNKKVGKLRVDMVIENTVLLELKSLTGNIAHIFEKQVISYLKASGLKIALLINFGNKSCQVNRFVN